MSTKNDEYQVIMVRIQKFDINQPITFNYDTRIKILYDTSRKLSYLRVISDGQNVYTKVLGELQWIPESSGKGVVTVCSQEAKVVIIYDENDQSVCEFFHRLRSLIVLESRSISPNSDQEQVKFLIDDLIKSINTGYVDGAENIAMRLSELQVRVQFKLTNKVNNQDGTDENRTESESSILRLKLVMECAIERNSIETSLNIHFGTKLRSLKAQIEKETGIKSNDQYWFAFDRCPIPDEYVFGSSTLIDSNQNPYQSSDRFIQSGDTLYLYITQPNLLI